MGKLSDLALIKTANSNSFAYTPPDAAFGAMRTLVKPLLSYPAEHPATVSADVLGSILRGLRRASPQGRIVIVDSLIGDVDPGELFGGLGVIELLDQESRLTTLESLILEEYPNPLPQPMKYASFNAPEYLAEYECIIVVSPLKHVKAGDVDFIAGATMSLFGFLPKAQYPDWESAHHDIETLKSLPNLLTDVYATIGKYIHGAVIDLTQKYVRGDGELSQASDDDSQAGKVIWGDDMLAVDETACKIAAVPTPAYLESLRKLKKLLADD